MYIHDPQFSGVRNPGEEHPLASRAVVPNSSYIVQGTTRSERYGESTASYGWTNIGFGEPLPKQSAPNVRALQESLNKWRVLKGQTSIKEDGLLTAETKNAVTEFQTASGLKRPDGIAGPATGKRLTLILEIQKNLPVSVFFPRRLVELVGHPGFGMLDPPLQDDTLHRILSYAKGATNDNILNLSDLVVRLSARVPAPIKKRMLGLLAARPGNTRLATALTVVANEFTFRNTAQSKLIWVLNLIESYAGDQNKLGNLSMLMAGLPFDQLTSKSQNLMLLAVRNHAKDIDLVSNFIVLGGIPAFFRLNQLTQTEVINRIVNYPRDTSNVFNLMSLVTTPGFEDLAWDVRAQILEGLPLRFNNVGLDPVKIGNLMTVVTTFSFPKILPEFRALLLDFQAARPDNAQLANALASIPYGQLRDRRNANQTITQVNDSIP